MPAGIRKMRRGQATAIRKAREVRVVVLTHTFHYFPRIAKKEALLLLRHAYDQSDDMVAEVRPDGIALVREATYGDPPDIGVIATPSTHGLD